jgi:hypothetical protein
MSSNKISAFGGEFLNIPAREESVMLLSLRVKTPTFRLSSPANAATKEVLPLPGFPCKR